MGWRLWRGFIEREAIWRNVVWVRRREVNGRLTRGMCEDALVIAWGGDEKGGIYSIVLVLTVSFETLTRWAGEHTQAGGEETARINGLEK
ncbi:hypothetical protein BJX64DRAFT_271283 [Aspergillus heterothallicus]